MLIRYSPNARGKAVRTALIYTKKEHGIQKELIDVEAIRIISHLRNYGFEGYIVGGAVRDLLIGRTPKDFDIVTNAEPAKIKRLFRNSRIIGKRFRLAHIFFGEKIFEVSTFRSLIEGTTGNSFGTMEEDVQRRDFTLNALYYDPIKEQVIDYVGGVKDIHNKKIQPVISLKIIFNDDPVRMIRAIKYAVSTKCSIPFSLRRKIRSSSELLQPVSPSRLTEEIIKILNSGNACDIVQQALKFDLYMYLQPAACSLIDESDTFARDYSQSLSKLDELVASEKETRLGRKLVFLIQDLIAIITDWKGQSSEVYNKVYHECRRFIIPMNPPRIELEYAVRWCLKEGGMSIKMSRSRDRRTVDTNRQDPKKDFTKRDAEDSREKPVSRRRPQKRRRPRQT